ncbi:MAG: YaaL family protein [Bacteroidota bacterium]
MASTGASWQDRFKAVRARLLGLETATEVVPALEEAVEEARTEWYNARRYFECVSEPDLVDQAIYSMEAAERKYMYLLRLAKANDLQVLH